MGDECPSRRHPEQKTDTGKKAGCPLGRDWREAAMSQGVPRNADSQKLEEARGDDPEH